MSIISQLTRLKNAKAAIKAALLGKGVTVPDDFTLTEVSGMIDGISGGGGGAKEPYIEETYDANGNLIEVNLVGQPYIRDYEFYECRYLAQAELPSSVTSIGRYAFYSCSDLARISLPSSITSIGGYAFYGCYNMTPKSLSLPSSVISIGTNAFYGCLELFSVTFNGKPDSIGSDAFFGCMDLKIINVPWASGEVAGAPWGASYATINYNYTG